MDSVSEAKEKGILSASQKQGNRKKDRDKRFIQKTHFLAACRFKNYFKTSLLISSQQTAYVKNRHISESGRLISHIAEIAKIKKKQKVF